jgi:PmbA protein
MNTNNDINTELMNYIKNLLEKAEAFGFSESEVYYESGKSLQLQVLNGVVNAFESSSSSGLSFRGKCFGQMGYAFSEEFSDESIDYVLTQAKEHCRILETKEPETLYKGDESYRESNAYTELIDQLPYQYYENTALAIEKNILKYDPRIVAVDYLSVSYGSSTEFIVNSLGLNCSNKDNMISVFAYNRCKENDQVKTGYSQWIGRDPQKLNIEIIAAEAASDCLGKLGATSISSGKYKVVLDARATADLLSTFSGVFSGDLIQKGFSLLAGKIGTQIASDVISIRDDGYMPSALVSVPFDSEGVATKNKVLVDKGILVSVLHNRKTASIEKIETTGNGFKSGLKGSVTVMPTNLYIENGTKSLSELMNIMQDGVYIKDLAGLHSGANEISGDFSLSCEGFLIEKSEIIRPIDQITISGNLFVMLKNISDVANDLYLNPPSAQGSIGSPSILIQDMSISGD